MKSGHRHILLAAAGLLVLLAVVVGLGQSEHGSKQPVRAVDADAIGEADEPPEQAVTPVAPFKKPFIPPKLTTSTTSMAANGEIAGATFANRGPAPADIESRPDRVRPAGQVVPRETAQARHATLAATPAPTFAFSSGTGSAQVSVGGSPADSNVAVSRTNICITTRGAFACYTKAGTLVAPGAGLSASPYSAADFFAASGLPIGTPGAKDGRIVFDQYRMRFFMDFQTRENPGRIMIAVSKSEDPRDGWWTYADTVGDSTYFTHDYQKIGVNAKYFLVSDAVCVGAGDCPLWKNFMYSANSLASGSGDTRSEWDSPAANGSSPCVDWASTYDSFWVNRDDDTHVSVWSVGNDGTVYRRTTTVQA